MLGLRKNSSSVGYDPNYIVGLDLGTTKITVVVAEYDPINIEAHIIGTGQASSQGIRKGLIVNLEKAVTAVKEAIYEAENMAGPDIKDVIVSFSGSDIQSVRTKGAISLGHSPREVRKLDIERVIEAAQLNTVIPPNKTLLHTIPVEYSLDDNSGIDDPLGMTGTRLNINLESVIVPSAVIQNVYNCVTRAGLDVSGFVIKPLASALGALTPEESAAGAVCADIGGGTSGIAIFKDGRPQHLSVIAIGGDHITNDVALILKIPNGKAEDIKKEANVSSADDSNSIDKLEFEYNDRSYSYSISQLNDVVRDRIEELMLSLVKPEIAASSVGGLPGGIILTGGVAMCSGVDEFISHTMDMPVRIANPLDTNSMYPGRNGPEYSCAGGIIRYAIERERDPRRYITPDIDELIQTAKPALNKGKPWHDGEQEPERKPRGISIIDTIKDAFRDLF
ncbi:cell division protein FtsA [Synergistales bacterium]|nr:cell division protein FtsA [Synergistales bacterium]